MIWLYKARNSLHAMSLRQISSSISQKPLQQNHPYNPDSHKRNLWISLNDCHSRYEEKNTKHPAHFPPDVWPVPNNGDSILDGGDDGWRCLCCQAKLQVLKSVANNIAFCPGQWSSLVQIKPAKLTTEPNKDRIDWPQRGSMKGQEDRAVRKNDKCN